MAFGNTATSKAAQEAKLTDTESLINIELTGKIVVRSALFFKP